MKKSKENKKYYMSVGILNLKDKRKVYLINLTINNKKKAAYHYKYELEELANRLEIDIKTVDHVYSNYAIHEFADNKNYDFILSFLPPSISVNMCIICKNKSSQKKLDEILNRLKELDDNEYLNPIF